MNCMLKPGHKGTQELVCLLCVGHQQQPTPGGSNISIMGQLSKQCVPHAKRAQAATFDPSPICVGVWAVPYACSSTSTTNLKPCMQSMPVLPQALQI